MNYERKRKMKYLLFVPEDGEEICYDIKGISSIVCGYAENLLTESDLYKNDFKPLEMVTKIIFFDGKTVAYRTAGSIMYFDD